MNNKKIERQLVKIAIGAVFSVLLGIVYKQGEYAAEAIDEKYEKNHGLKPSKLF